MQGNTFHKWTKSMFIAYQMCKTCQVGQYKQAQCSICALINIICIHCIFKKNVFLSRMYTCKIAKLVKQIFQYFVVTVSTVYMYIICYHSNYLSCNS